MKVLHVITGLGLGGAESMLTALLTRAPRSDMEQAVVTLLPGGENAARLRAANIPVSDLGMRRGIPNPLAVLRLVRCVKSFAPDVVQSWMYHADLVSTAAVRLLRAPPRLVWGIRCSDMDPRRYGHGLRMVIAACARLSRMPDAVLVNSAAGWRVHEALGYRPRRVEIVPNGLDIERFRPSPEIRDAVRRELGIPSDALVAVHVARVDPMKDHGTFLSALDSVPGVIALAIGAGTEGLPERRNLLRMGPRSDVPRLLAACDIAVNSSAFGEGFSNAIAEGMATGLIPVATDVGDTRSIVGETGALVPPRDAAALGAAIAALVALTPEARADKSRAARARIETEFPLARAAARYEALYRSLA